MEQEDEFLIPLKDQRVFGAGIKRKLVAFVPATASSPIPPTSASTNIGDLYLSIVFPSKQSISLDGKGKEIPNGSETTSSNLALGIETQQTSSKCSTCQVCNLPIVEDTESTGIISKPHQALIAHQVCLPHSSPPSHLDRKRPGLKYLSSYGWDPDSRLGLGAAGEGIRAPIKVKIKNDTVGLGVEKLEGSNLAKHRPVEVQKLDAKQVRNKELEGRKTRVKLQKMIYGNDDVEKYLGNS